MKFIKILDIRNLQERKNYIRDMIDGELNRISVSDSFEEKECLYSILKENIERYYEICCECTRVLHKYEVKDGD